jgi:hypothetical protein
MPNNTKRVTPPKFNYNSTIKTAAMTQFSCSPTAEDEGTEDFTDTQSESELEDIEVEDHFQSICCLTSGKKHPFAAW